MNKFNEKWRAYSRAAGALVTQLYRAVTVFIM